MSEIELAAALSDLFGGTWTAWRNGTAGSPGARLWTQVLATADERLSMAGMLLLSDRITSDGLRKIPVAALESSLAQAHDDQRQADLDALPPLERGSLTMDQFAPIVAAHFKAWSRYSSNPSKAMVKASGAKENTVYSWIREARLRGLLPVAKAVGSFTLEAGQRRRVATNVPFEVEIVRPPGEHVVEFDYNGRTCSLAIDGHPGPVGTSVHSATSRSMDTIDGVVWDARIFFVAD